MSNETEVIKTRLQNARLQLAATEAEHDQARATLADPETGAIFMLAELVDRGKIETPLDADIAMQCARLVYCDLLAAETRRVLDDTIEGVAEMDAMEGKQ